MTDQRPNFILRNCILYADRQNMIGQIGDITPPVPEAKREELRQAGMIKPRMIHMGYNALEFSFTMAGLDPKILQLFGLSLGVETPFMITGALVDEDGTVHSAIMNIRGKLYKADPGTWKGGDMASNSYAVDVDYYKLEIDGVPYIEVDDFDIKIGGTSRQQSIRTALLL